MALLFMDGFEMGDGALKWDTVSGYATASTSPRVTGGGYYLHPSSSASLTKQVTVSAQVTAGVAFRLTSFDTNDQLICLSMSNTYAPLWVGVSSGGYLQLNMYPSLLASPQTLATGTTRLSLNLWYYLEMQATLNDTTGTAQVRLNGVTTPEISYTGNTYYPGGSSTMDTMQVQIHGDVDDLYVLNSVGSANTTFQGDVRVYALLPNGNGSSSQLTGSDGDSTNNYQLVNEQPYNTANYVGSAVSGQRDTYTLADLPATVTSVVGVQNNLIAAKSDAGTISMKPALKIGAGVYYGATRSPNTAYGAYQDVYDKNPATSASWTVSDVNSLEGGMEVV